MCKITKSVVTWRVFRPLAGEMEGRGKEKRGEGRGKGGMVGERRNGERNRGCVKKGKGGEAKDWKGRRRGGEWFGCGPQLQLLDPPVSQLNNALTQQ